MMTNVLDVVTTTSATAGSTAATHASAPQHTPMAPPPPPFDAAAIAAAKEIAAAHGKPKTRDEGLRAIHSVAHGSTPDEALRHFGVPKQRYSEWKRLLPATAVAPQHSEALRPVVAAFDDETLLVSADWLHAQVPGLYDLEVGVPQRTPDGLQAIRRVRARLDIDESGAMLETLITYECGPAAHTMHAFSYVHAFNALSGTCIVCGG